MSREEKSEKVKSYTKAGLSYEQAAKIDPEIASMGKSRFNRYSRYTVEEMRDQDREYHRKHRAKNKKESKPSSVDRELFDRTKKMVSLGINAPKAVELGLFPFSNSTFSRIASSNSYEEYREKVVEITKSVNERNTKSRTAPAPTLPLNGRTDEIEKRLSSIEGVLITFNNNTQTKLNDIEAKVNRIEGWAETSTEEKKEGFNIFKRR